MRVAGVKKEAFLTVRNHRDKTSRLSRPRPADVSTLTGADGGKISACAISRYEGRAALPGFERRRDTLAPMALEVSWLDGEGEGAVAGASICVLRGMTPRRGWAGQSCTLYPEGAAYTKAAIEAFTRAQVEAATLRIAGSEGTRSIVASIHVAIVDPAGAYVSAVFVTDTVYAGT